MSASAQSGTKRICRSMGAAVLALALSGCTSLLPKAEQDYETPWQGYAEAEAMFEKIVPGATKIADLQVLGIDPKRTPNITLLAHPDVLRRLTGSSSIDTQIFNPRLRECIEDHERCFAYEIEQKQIIRKRYGNFWLDFLNFDRKTDITGWEFNAVIVIHGETVAYKMWSGKPNLHQFEHERNPLGPLQGVGSSVIGK
ncbi:MAG: hypothetical protein HYS18_04205 [Burkholderiales bacterium]|nr:hypothetical protein [Burkholderiales bacterium]